MKDYYFQQEAVDATLDYCRRKSGNPLIVLPTGSGKSHVISMLGEAIYEIIPDKKILVLAHRKELIEQNASKFKEDVGIFHAGVGRKDINDNIIVAGIQSIYNGLDKFSNVGVVLVDEADMIPFSEDTVYRRVLEHFNVRVIGLTATPYRLDGGFIYGDGDDFFFDKVVYEKTVREMIDESYLCPLVSKISNLQPDLSKVKVKMGDYVIAQLEEAMIDEELIAETIESLLSYTAERKKVLIFSPSIKHAQIIQQLVPNSAIITGDLSIKERVRIIEEFKHNRIKYLINVNVLTVGFDDPSIDCVVMLRPTQSTRLYVQMVGRGLRTAQNKEDCLVLDYAGNINTHGCIDKVEVIINPLTSKAEPEEFDHKICPSCEAVNEIDATECFECGYVMKEVRSVKHFEEPEDIDINHHHQEPEWRKVDAVSYRRHKGKKGKKDTLKCEFTCFMETFSEWLCVEHEGFAYKKAVGVLASRGYHLSGDEWYYMDYVYTSAIDFLEKHHEELLKKPTRIKIDVNEKFPRIVDYDYEAIEEEKTEKENYEDFTCAFD